MFCFAFLDGSVLEETKEITKTCEKGSELCETGTDTASNKSSTNIFDSEAMLPSIDSNQPSRVPLCFITFYDLRIVINSHNNSIP